MLFHPFRYLLIALFTSLFFGVAQAGQLTVFAAASLKDALEEVTQNFENEFGHRVSLSLAGSSVMARQIQLGAPVDVFISANANWMDFLQKEDLVDPSTRFDLLGNQLVLIAHGAKAPKIDLLDLPVALGNDHLAMAQINAVPAGMYGKAAFQHLKIWETLKTRVAQSDNVRSALVLVSLGEAPYGVVYATDANADKNVNIVARFPTDSYPQITYPVAAVAGQNNPVIPIYLAYLRTPQARKVFEHFGFSVLDQQGE
jgi:molybdate transport system substrate-binding protein